MSMIYIDNTTGSHTATSFNHFIPYVMVRLWLVFSQDKIWHICMAFHRIINDIPLSSPLYDNWWDFTQTPSDIHYNDQGVPSTRHGEEIGQASLTYTNTRNLSITGKEKICPCLDWSHRMNALEPTNLMQPQYAAWDALLQTFDSLLNTY